MPRALPSMSEEQFWAIVEECRHASFDVFSFDERLMAYLAECAYPMLIGFYHVLGDKTGLYPNSSFRQVLREAGCDYSSDNSWQRYMGWLVAQGREFYERVLDDPEVARTRLPESDDYQNRELVIFAPNAATRKRTADEWGLSDVLACYETPPCPPVCEPDWRTPLVIALASAADAAPLADGQLDLARLAVLSDALEEAGCTDQGILGHLRDGGPHLHGCWAVAILLGEEA